jgi:hypothetical protein
MLTGVLIFGRLDKRDVVGQVSYREHAIGQYAVHPLNNVQATKIAL